MISDHVREAQGVSPAPFLSRHREKGDGALDPARVMRFPATLHTGFAHQLQPLLLRTPAVLRRESSPVLVVANVSCYGSTMSLSRYSCSSRSAAAIGRFPRTVRGPSSCSLTSELISCTCAMLSTVFVSQRQN